MGKSEGCSDYLNKTFEKWTSSLSLEQHGLDQVDLGVLGALLVNVHEASMSDGLDKDVWCNCIHLCKLTLMAMKRVPLREMCKPYIALTNRTRAVTKAVCV